IPLFFIFPLHPEVAMAAAGIMAFGDGSATIVGLLAGRSELPWNRKKSWAGTAAYVAVALPVATWIYWHGSQPHLPFELAFRCVGPAVFISAVVESLPLCGNDNLSVGLSLAASMTAAQGLLVGWP